uniref:Peptidase C1A papain C-terminal domain-containing protein n=1 Tax=Fibrocapsa japonica TaxID=94617 RepID=A0A7S2V244_9STRA
MILKFITASILCGISFVQGYDVYSQNELVPMEGHKVKQVLKSPLPHEYLNAEALPESFTWKDVNGMSFVTRNLNQHIPQYCGSCWAHATLSALADRVKIARKAKGVDINLSVQVILNCAQNVAGSCHGGEPSGVYEWAHNNSVPFDTCQQYKAIDEECIPSNICRSCTSFSSDCYAVSQYPNVTVSEYGLVQGEANMMTEIYERGPIACDINSGQLHTYTGGIVDYPEVLEPNHSVEVVGWGFEEGKKIWYIRNSWGEYWGEQGWFRMVRGENQLGIESGCTWAVPGSWTEV